MLYCDNPSRFIPPDDFNLALLTLELEFVKKRTKDEQVLDPPFLDAYSAPLKHFILAPHSIGMPDLCLGINSVLNDSCAIAPGKSLNVFVSQVDAVLLAEQIRKRFINQVRALCGFACLLSLKEEYTHCYCEDCLCCR
ncbi:vesicle-fusing ATPase [Sarracenia purpurea var. burkii]